MRRVGKFNPDQHVTLVQDDASARSLDKDSLEHLQTQHVTTQGSRKNIVFQTKS